MILCRTGMAFTVLASVGVALIGIFEVASAAEPAGRVDRARGAATASGEAGTRPLSAGVEIFVGDTITTGSDARLRVILLDDTEITLGDDSELVIDRYVYQPAEGTGGGALRLAAGVFRAVTGKLAEVSGQPFRIATGVATIGVRGTEFWGEQRVDRLLVALLGGAGVFVENEQGRVDIVDVQFATRVTGPGVAPSEPFRLSDEDLRAALETVAF